MTLCLSSLLFWRNGSSLGDFLAHCSFDLQSVSISIYGSFIREFCLILLIIAFACALPILCGDRFQTLSVVSYFSLKW